MDHIFDVSFPADGGILRYSAVNDVPSRQEKMRWGMGNG